MGKTQQAATDGWILVVDDDTALCDLIVRKLAREGLAARAAASGQEAIALIVQEAPLLILLDYRLRDMTGQEVARDLATRGLEIPFIMMTGQGDERLAVEIMKLGAADYLVKDTELVDRLPAVLDRVLRAIEMKNRLREAEEALKIREQRFAQLIQNSYDTIVILDADGIQRYVSPSAEQVHGYTPEELVDIPVIEQMIHPDDQAQVLDAFRSVIETGTGVVRYRHRRKTGGFVYLEARGTNQLDNPGIRGIVVNVRDITQDVQAEEAQARLAQEWQTTFDSVNDAIWLLDADQRILRTNRKAEEIFSRPAAEMLGRHCWEIVHGSQQPIPECPVMRMLCSRQREGMELQIGERWFSLRVDPIQDAEGKITGAVHVVSDITDHKLAEEDKDRLQDQLTQAQKMESVGRLAGGVAHDFNNMLGAILGNVELALLEIGPDDPVHARLNEIEKAAHHSAELTRQLLAFARKQTVAPKVLELNGTVAGMLKMLRRLIGEDIELVWRPGADPGNVFVDPSQLDQILANLCVNARDAITDTGTITIETGNATFGEDDCPGELGGLPGEFVVLVVRDSGCGMDAETLGHLFEPFFTTKEPGKGTGLGLAMVYGAVKQNNGFIKVESEPEHGSVFRIFLPRHLAKTLPRPEQHQSPAPLKGKETILLVEDEPSILSTTTLLLEGMGYTVIPARTPGEAIALAREHRGPIDLLLTDVVMPEMNGRDLAGNLLSIFPDIKRLFMSGYTADIIAHHGVLDEGVAFIQKPFLMKALAARIREVLDRE